MNYMLLRCPQCSGLMTGIEVEEGHHSCGWSKNKATTPSIEGLGAVPVRNERPARHVYVFKCVVCGKEFSLDESERNKIKDYPQIYNPPNCCEGFCFEDRIEIYDADGNRTAVIV